MSEADRKTASTEHHVDSLGQNVQDSAELVELGVISKPHGVRGELRVHPWNPDSALLRKLENVHIRDPGGEMRQLRVVKATRAAKFFILDLEGVRGREAADALRGQDVLVPRDALPELEGDEFYFVDLVGLPVRRHGQVVGEVVEVLRYPSADCLLVKSADGKREVPLLEPWVEAIDLATGEIRVGPWDDVPLRE